MMKCTDGVFIAYFWPCYFRRACYGAFEGYDAEPGAFGDDLTGGALGDMKGHYVSVFFSHTLVDRNQYVKPVWKDMYYLFSVLLTACLI